MRGRRGTLSRRGDGSNITPTTRRPLDLSHLRSFLAVYRIGTLTRAAEVLGLSQPAVSQHVRLLESATGQSLFVRLPRGMSPTPAGHDLARRVAGPLDALEEVAQSRSIAPPGPDAAIRLGGPPHLLGAAALVALAPLTTRGVRLEIVARSGRRAFTELAQGRIDLAMTYAPTTDQPVVTRFLFAESVALIAAPCWARRIDAAALVQDPPAVLATVPLVATGDDYVTRYLGSLRNGTSLGIAVVCPDVHGVVGAVLSGTGFGIVPAHSVAEYRENHRLIEIHRAVGGDVYLHHRASEDRWWTLEAADRLAHAAAAWEAPLRPTSTSG